MKNTIFVCATTLVFCGCGRVAITPIEQRVKGDMNSIRSVLKIYQINNGHFPSTAQGLQALVARPVGEPEPMSWTALMDRVPIDPWAQEYRYECSQSIDGTKQSNQFRIISTGKDLTLGTEDDIVHEEPFPKSP